MTGKPTLSAEPANVVSICPTLVSARTSHARRAMVGRSLMLAVVKRATVPDVDVPVNER